MESWRCARLVVEAPKKKSGPGHPSARYKYILFVGIKYVISVLARVFLSPPHNSIRARSSPSLPPSLQVTRSIGDGALKKAGVSRGVGLGFMVRV